MSIEPHITILVILAGVALHFAISHFEKRPPHLADDWIRQRWRRASLVRLSCCLLLSVLACVYVAWACGFTSRHFTVRDTRFTRHRDPARGEGQGELAIQLHASRAMYYATVFVHGGSSQQENDAAGVDSWLTRTLVDRFGREIEWPEPLATRDLRGWALGWPYPCLYAITDFEMKPGGVIAGESYGFVALPSIVRGSIFRPFGFTPVGPGPFDVPARVHWTSTAANVLLYTLPLYGAWTFIASRRVRRRFDRGECPRCHYSVASLAAGIPCPECGLATQAIRNPVSSSS